MKVEGRKRKRASANDEPTHPCKYKEDCMAKPPGLNKKNPCKVDWVDHDQRWHGMNGYPIKCKNCDVMVKSDQDYGRHLRNVPTSIIRGEYGLRVRLKRKNPGFRRDFEGD